MPAIFMFKLSINGKLYRRNVLYIFIYLFVLYILYNSKINSITAEGINFIIIISYATATL
jgi:hypothetical protein